MHCMVQLVDTLGCDQAALGKHPPLARLQAGLLFPIAMHPYRNASTKFCRLPTIRTTLVTLACWLAYLPQGVCGNVRKGRDSNAKVLQDSQSSIESIICRSQHSPGGQVANHFRQASRLTQREGWGAANQAIQRVQHFLFTRGWQSYQ